jgi:hypothetical protein
MKITFLLLIVVILATTAAGCNQAFSATPVTVTSVIPSKEVVVYFPVEKEPAKGYMLLAFQGKLFIDDSGYIRVDWTEGEHVLIIWPYGYSIKLAEDGNVWITDEQGQPVWRTGDTVTLGGGFGAKNTAEQRIGKALPAGCEGPYFLAGPRWERG